jgi:GDP-L-fucose synthase
VIPALMRKAHDAKANGVHEVVIWGSGTPRREFLHVDDCAAALVHLMKVYSGDSHVNVGSGEDITILDLMKVVASVVGFRGTITRDETKPDGTPRKLMDSSKLRALGWVPKIGLQNGLSETYEWFLANKT